MDSVLYQSLQQEFVQKNLNLERIADLLKASMVQLTSSGLLSTSPATLSPTQATTVRDVLEMGAYWSIHSHDGAAFDRYLAQLTSFYDEPLLGVAPSPRMYPLLGLRLLNLLVSGRRPLFYMAVARLSPAARADPHLAFVLNLERCLLEGTYHRLLAAQQAPPTPEYAWWVASLLEAVRWEIAEGLEATYLSIGIETALAKLLLPSSQVEQLLEFGKQRGWQHDAQGRRLMLPVKSGPELHEATPAPALMLERVLGYAAELEQIV